MEETTIRDPERIRQGCAKKLLKVIRGDKARAVLGYFLRETWTIPSIRSLRLTSEGRIEVELADEAEVDLGKRATLIRNIHAIAKAASLDGDELGYLLAQVARIEREE